MSIMTTCKSCDNALTFRSYFWVNRFTQYLDEPTQTVEEDSVWIFAVGLPDNAWVGKHRIHGAFWLGLSENCIPDPSTAVEEEVPPTGSNNDATDPDFTVPDNAGKEAEDPTAPVVDVNHTGDSDSGDSEDEQIYGNSGSNTGSASASVSSLNGGMAVANQADEDTIRNLWVAHGIFMFLAWGICAPLAIGAPLLRNVSFLQDFGRWYKIHFYGNILLVLFTFIGFFLAVAATSKDGDEHFTDEVHKKAGLAIFIIVLFQAVAGYFRPPATSVSTTNPSLDHPSETNELEAASDSDGDIEVSPSHPTKSSSSTSASSNHDSSNVKSKYRICWEITHRMVAVILVGLAWYNCDSGYQLMGEDYGESFDWTTAFWVVTGLLSGSVFFFAYIIRV